MSHQNKRTLTLMLLGLLLAGLPIVGRAQTIPNPSFEADSFTVFPGYVSGNTAITGWTVSPTDRAGLNPATSSPFANNGLIPHGTNVAFLQSRTNASTLATVITGLEVGHNYVVTFRANCRNAGYVAPNAFLSLNGGAFTNITAGPAVGGSNQYYTNSFGFLATAPTAALVLSNFTAGDATLLVDNFTIADPFLVTTTGNAGPGSLRDAVALAGSPAYPTANIITFSPALSGQTIVLASEIVLNSSVTIDASDLPGGLTIDGGTGAHRLFSVSASRVVNLLGLNLTRGHGGGAASSGSGGAILNNGTLTLTGCALHDNTADQIGGAIRSSGTLALTNCTLSGNVAAALSGPATFGGAIFLDGGTATLNHCTAAGNTAAGGSSFGGGLYGTVTVINSIVAGNTAGTGADIFGAPALFGQNVIQIISSAPTGTGTFTNANPQLAALGNYGGPTLTRPPTNGSPAIDAAISSTLLTDQRGVLRPIGLAADIGAVETAAIPAVATLPATAMSNSVATLQGLVTPNGASTAAWFEWGTVSGHYTQSNAPVVAGSGATPVAASHALTGLTPGVIYHYRVVATNSLGTARGDERLFGSPTPVALNGGATVTNECHAAFHDPATVTNAPLVVVAGFDHNLALKSDGTVIGWGNNAEGESDIPADLGNVVAIAAAGNYSLALKSDGTIAAWGDNSLGQTAVPAGLSNVVAMAAGGFHGLALKSDRTVVGWGNHGSGQTNVPAGLSNVVAVAGGSYHSLALLGNGTVVGWGDNLQGQATIPASLSNVVALAGGENHSLALRRDGTVAGWGSYQLPGDPIEYVPATVPASLSNVVAIAAGKNHSLALKSDGTVLAWGQNHDSTGTTGQTNVPAGLSNVVAVAAGDAFSMALRRDGTVVAWGDNSGGRTNPPASLNQLPITYGGTFSTNNAPGTYTRTYTATNSLGGIATPAIRTIVVQDTTPPVLTLNGGNPLVWPVNTPFVDPGATASDLCAGALAVSTNGAVNIAVSGTNSLTYIATDASGNSATNTRTVIVHAPLILLVTTTNDAGPGSLRDAVGQGLLGDVIHFDAGLSGQRIVLTGGELLLNQSLSIDASALARPVMLDGNGAGRVFNVAAGSTVSLDSLVITNGSGHAYGGGILNRGTLTVRRCTIDGNFAGNDMFEGGGGGLANLGTCVLNETTVARNWVDAATIGGGGLFNSGTLTLNQCTVAGNDGHWSLYGGGGLFAGSGSVSVNQSTFSQNYAGSFGDGIYINSGSAVVSNSIVAGNYKHNFDGFVAPELLGANLIGGDPVLAPLADYGGPTPTMPPLPGSPALNGCTSGTGFITDQRGLPRVFGPAADLGAVEVQSVPVVATTLPPTDMINSSATLQATVNPNGAATLAWFEWGVGGGENRTAPAALGAGTNTLPFSTALEGFPQGALLQVRVAASNAAGVVYGAVVAFGTPAIPLAGSSSLMLECHALAATPWLENPGFEHEPFSNGVGYIIENGPIYGWSASHADRAGVNTSAGPFLDNGGVPEGAVVGFLQSAGEPTTLDSVINGLTPGAVYQVQFRANARAATDAPSAGWSVDGGAESAVTASPAVGMNAWHLNTALFIATHTSAALRVRNQTEGDSTVLLDDFTVVKVPTNVAGTLHVSGSVQRDVPGVYPLIYSLTNHLGAVSVVTQTVTVVDTLAPKLVLLGDELMNVALHSPFADPGATASDLCAGLLNVVTNGVVNTGVAGTYLLLYTATDHVGNATTNQRTVVVYEPGFQTVTTTNDAGPGSLRQAIAVAAPGDTIRFHSSLSGARIGIVSRLLLDKNLTIDGTMLEPGVTISANQSGRVFEVAAGATNVLSGLTIADGLAYSLGYEVVDGGGIHNSGHLTVRRCAILRCRADAGGVGTSRGGGLFNAGVLHLEQNTFSQNAAVGHFTSPYDDGANAYGGAIFNAGTLIAWHNTVAGNTAQRGINLAPTSEGVGRGGGIYNAGTMTLSNSLVAGNTASNSDPDLAGPITTGGQNFIGGDPQLAPLGDYGGPTPTLPLRRFSDARNLCLDTPYATDQRGYPRTVGLADIGAYEGGNYVSNFHAHVWELIPGDDTNQHSAAFDHDGDGVGNHDEWIALTDPAKPASVLRLGVQAVNETNRVIRFPMAAGRTYTLWAAPGVTGSYTNTGLTPQPGAPGVGVFTHAVGTNAPQLFYRVQAAR